MTFRGAQGALAGLLPGDEDPIGRGFVNDLAGSEVDADAVCLKRLNLTGQDRHDFGVNVGGEEGTDAAFDESRISGGDVPDQLGNVKAPALLEVSRTLVMRDQHFARKARGYQDDGRFTKAQGKGCQDVGETERPKRMALPLILGLDAAMRGEKVLKVHG